MTFRTDELRGYQPYGIGRLTTGQDGGVEAESYYLIRSRAPRSPLCGPREPDPLLLAAITGGGECLAILLVVAVAAVVSALQGG